jgi:hypothetical protein
MRDRVLTVLVNGGVIAVAFILINGGFSERTAVVAGLAVGLVIGILVVVQNNPFDLYKLARRFAKRMTESR